LREFPPTSPASTAVRMRSLAAQLRLQFENRRTTRTQIHGNDRCATNPRSHTRAIQKYCHAAVNILPLIGAVSAQTYLIYTGSFAALTTFLLVLSQLQNRRSHALRKKSDQETAARLMALEDASQARNSFL